MKRTIEAIRKAIATGTYVTPRKVRIAAERMAADLGIPCRIGKKQKRHG